MPQRLLVPLFQRPYVWSEEAQWLPLWEDIRRLVDRRISGDNQATHFLGAVVLQHQANHVGALAARTVIDGQQRLTTLQIFLDVVHGQFEIRKFDALARQLADLVENAEHFRERDEDRYKVWPTNRDRAAFNEVMSAENPIDYSQLENSNSRLVKAHEFFSRQVSAWLDDGDVPARATHLAGAVTTQLQLVAIELQYDEDAQEIFETLNARGTPLTPADLIKNFVFQRLGLTPTETEQAYRDYWAQFETPFWEQDVSTGRVTYSRSSLFLNQWLIATTLENVPAREVFAQFKRYVIDSKLPMTTILPAIKEAADRYGTMLRAAEDRTAPLSKLEMFVYRTGNLESEIVKPLLIWLGAAAQSDVPPDQVNLVLDSVESWLVRRALVRAKSQGTNIFLVDLLVHLSKQTHDRVGDATRDYLAEQTRDVSFWPGDAEVRRELESLVIYWRLRRGRLRMVLEALEDHERGFTSGKSKHEQPVIREVCTVEHIMPQGWRSHWPAAGSLVEEQERDRLVQTLGNLTLLTQGLNASVSNAAWLGTNGKREGLNRHTSLLLTREVVDSAKSEWTDSDIARRTQKLISSILEIWRVPIGHVGEARGEIERAVSRVALADLVRAGLVPPGTTLYARPQSQAGKTCLVSDDGRLFVNGEPFDTLSAAARAVTGSQSEAGWWFWLMDAGSDRSLSDVRREYLEGFEDSVAEIPDED
jgi:Protein of unknown function DUF262/Protein of unknown function (DUF1524)/Restriction Enzyme Adenine Methylase Associated